MERIEPGIENFQTMNLIDSSYIKILCKFSLTKFKSHGNQ
jgi:hypothetical protein